MKNDDETVSLSREAAIDYWADIVRGDFIIVPNRMWKDACKNCTEKEKKAMGKLHILRFLFDKRNDLSKICSKEINKILNDLKYADLI